MAESMTTPVKGVHWDSSLDVTQLTVQQALEVGPEMKGECCFLCRWNFKPVGHKKCYMVHVTKAQSARSSQFDAIKVVQDSLGIDLKPDIFKYTKICITCKLFMAKSKETCLRKEELVSNVRWTFEKMKSAHEVKISPCAKSPRESPPKVPDGSIQVCA